MKSILFLFFFPLFLFGQSYSYEGPTSRTPGNAKLIRVELIVKDSPEAGGVQIKTVEFNKKNIPLQPRDINGNRGSASFQLPPGKYKLNWSVQRDTFEWPRVLTFNEEVTLDPRDLWLQIIIEGETASIR